MVSRSITICIDGDEEFIETYTDSDFQLEWRLPHPHRERRWMGLESIRPQVPPTPASFLSSLRRHATVQVLQGECWTIGTVHRTDQPLKQPASPEQRGVVVLTGVEKGDEVGLLLSCTTVWVRPNWVLKDGEYVEVRMDVSEVETMTSEDGGGEIRTEDNIMYMSDISSEELDDSEGDDDEGAEPEDDSLPISEEEAAACVRHITRGEKETPTSLARQYGVAVADIIRLNWRRLEAPGMVGWSRFRNRTEVLVPALNLQLSSELGEEEEVAEDEVVAVAATVEMGEEGREPIEQQAAAAAAETAAAVVAAAAAAAAVAAAAVPAAAVAAAAAAVPATEAVEERKGEGRGHEEVDLSLLKCEVLEHDKLCPHDRTAVVELLRARFCDKSFGSKARMHHRALIACLAEGKKLSTSYELSNFAGGGRRVINIGSPEITHLHVAIAKLQGRVIGASCVSSVFRCRREDKAHAAEIIMFAIEKEVEGLGFGHKLFEKVKMWAGERGCRWLLVLSASSEDKAKNWWIHQLEDRMSTHFNTANTEQSLISLMCPKGGIMWQSFFLPWKIGINDGGVLIIAVPFDEMDIAKAAKARVEATEARAEARAAAAASVEAAEARAEERALAAHVPQSSRVDEVLQAGDGVAAHQRKMGRRPKAALHQAASGETSGLCVGPEAPLRQVLRCAVERFIFIEVGCGSRRLANTMGSFRWSTLSIDDG